MQLSWLNVLHFRYYTILLCVYRYFTTYTLTHRNIISKDSASYFRIRWKLHVQMSSASQDTWFNFTYTNALVRTIGRLLLFLPFLFQRPILYTFFYLKYTFFFSCLLLWTLAEKISKQQLGWIKYTVIIILSNCYRSTWRIHIMMMGWLVCGGDFFHCYNL